MPSANFPSILPGGGGNGDTSGVLSISSSMPPIRNWAPPGGVLRYTNTIPPVPYWDYSSPAIVPSFLSEQHIAVDVPGGGATGNTGTIAVNVTGSNPVLIAIVQSEFVFDSSPSDPFNWYSQFNGQPGRLISSRRGYSGGTNNRLFRVYVWPSPPQGVNNCTITLGGGTSTPGTAANEFTMIAAVFNNVAQTLIPVRDCQADILNSLRTSETETVTSQLNDLVLHIIASSFAVPGTIGAGETSRVYAVVAGGLDDSSILLSTKTAASPTTTVSSSGWPGTKQVQGVALSLLPAGTPETIIQLSDTLQRANESPLSKSGAWGSAGPRTTAVNLVSNLMVGSTAGENMARIVSPVFGNNQRMQVTYKAAQFQRACVRIQSATDASCYTLSTNGASALVYVRIVDNGSALSYPEQVDLGLPRNLVDGDIFEIEAIGTTLNFYFNYDLLATRTATELTGGQPGVASFGTGSFCGAIEATSTPVRFNPTLT